MIGIVIQGRLGNQMFQYAFALAASKKLRTNFLLYENEYSTNDLMSYFQLKRYTPSFISTLQKKIFYQFKYYNNIIEVDESVKYAENKGRLGYNNCLYKGFFQSTDYFKGYEKLVKTEFTIKQEHVIDVRKLLQIHNNKPLIVAHVRRTDYLEYGKESLGGKNLTLPFEYYQLCFEKIGTLNNYNIVFVTDDPVYVRENFSHFNPIISSQNSSIIDFQILGAGKVIVVANSSFSWWAAYLSEQATKIFAPKYWLGFKVKKKYPPDIIPESWESVDFKYSRQYSKKVKDGA
jgi:hypothetical protein